MTSSVELVDRIADLLLGEGHSLATVESCTGGGIASLLTSVAGSSGWFERGFVTYSNAAKSELVGVDPGLIEQFGAVSIEVAEAMALGGVAHSNAHYAVSVTGIAGPDGGSADKPVGTVCIGWAYPDQTSPDQISPDAGNGSRVFSRRFQFDGDRGSVRQQSVDAALAGLIRAISG